LKRKGKNTSITIKDTKDLQRIACRLKQVNYPAYILWSIAINTGYRGCDVVKLTVKDIRETLKTGELVVLEEKTEKTRKVPFERVVILSNKLMNILEEYIKDKDDSEYLYYSKNNKNGVGNFKKHISRDRLGRIYKKIIVELGISKGTVGTHTPRKTYGYFQYLDHDRDIHYVQKLFGHSRPSITMDYIGLDEEMLKSSAKTGEKYVF
jgi:integrase